MSKNNNFIFLFIFITCIAFSQKKTFKEIEKDIKKNDSIGRLKGDYNEVIKLNLDSYYLSQKIDFTENSNLSQNQQYKTNNIEDYRTIHLGFDFLILKFLYGLCFQ